MNNLFSFNVIILFITIGSGLNVVGQNINEDVFVIVEEPPKYNGGQLALDYFLTSNLQYPESARKEGIEGTVFVTFIVELDGKVTNARILRGIHPDCDAEVLRVVGLMPAWIPAKQRGKPVRVQFNLPISFKL